MMMMMMSGGCLKQGSSMQNQSIQKKDPKFTSTIRRRPQFEHKRRYGTRRRRARNTLNRGGIGLRLLITYRSALLYFADVIQNRIRYHLHM